MPYSSITPVLKELHWLPIEARIKLKNKCLYSTTTTLYLATLIKSYNPKVRISSLMS